ncbi:triple tyrosine motif-containing protein, partial [Desulfonatronum sp. SC1]|uniref:triple tyrosine motif-containing protein n=1 Tax=Desulfonatronum sp. SC1 TaxID=2109626 RepID=UPI0018EE8DC2
MFFQDINVLGQSLRSEVHGELDTPIDQIERLKLTHVQNTISLEVLPLRMPYGAKFSWLLEGLDTEWSQPTNTRILNYTNLPTGNYVLRIRMYDNSMLNIIDERLITIHKLPPFWETWWFLLIVTTFLLSGFYLSLKYYISLIREL